MIFDRTRFYFFESHKLPSCNLFWFFFLHSYLLLGVRVYSAALSLCTCNQWHAGTTYSFRDKMPSILNHGFCASFERTPSSLYMEFLWHLEILGVDTGIRFYVQLSSSQRMHIIFMKLQ